MIEFVTDLEALRTAAEPLKFITDEGISKEEGDAIFADMRKAMEEAPDRLTLTATEIGVNKRIFCIRFEEDLRFFVNPIIIKKANFNISGETCACMLGKEILIARPEEITAVYHTAAYKYEENKFLGAAAKLFDQQCQMLDGILPSELGLVSDIEADGSLTALNEDELAELVEFYKDYIKVKTDNIRQVITEDSELAATFRELSFTEKVINGQAALVAPDNVGQTQKGQATAALIAKNITHNERANNKARLKQFLGRKGK